MRTLTPQGGIAIRATSPGGPCDGGLAAKNTARERLADTVSGDRVSVRLSGALLEHLDALAGARRLSRSALLRALVSEASMVSSEEVPSERELLAITAEKARGGNMAAVKLLLDRESRRDPDEAAIEAAFGRLDAGRLDA